MDFYARGVQGFEQGRQRAVRNRLNELTQIALTSPPELQRGIAAEMARVDAATGQQFAQQAREREMERLRAQATFLGQAPEPVQQGLYAAMRPQLERLGLGGLPEQYDSQLAMPIRNAVFAQGGTSGQNLTPTMQSIEQAFARGIIDRKTYEDAVRVALKTEAGAQAPRYTPVEMTDPNTGQTYSTLVQIAGYTPGGGAIQSPAQMPQRPAQQQPTQQPDPARVQQVVDGIMRQANALSARGTPTAQVDQFVRNSFAQAGIPIDGGEIAPPTPAAQPGIGNQIPLGPTSLTAAQQAANEAEAARLRALAEAGVEAQTRPGIEGATLEEKELVGMGSEFLKNARAAASMARNEVRNLGELERQLSRIDTGAFANTRIKLGSVAAYLGLAEGSEVSAAEAAAGITNRLALALRNPAGGEGMPGAMSDADRNFLVQSIPGIENTPDGWKMMIEWRRKLADAAIAQQREADRFIASGGKVKDLPIHMQQWADKNPIFGQPAKSSQSQQRQIRRTGTLNGRRVVEYTDGSREYAD